MRLIPDSRGGSLLRFAAGALIVIAFTATTTAVAGLLQIKQLTAYIGLTKALPHANIVIPNPGNPQNILIIGSDHRAGTPFSAANTDTMMLMRLDPNSSTINVLSIPRDLKVQIPEGGTFATDKINATYSVGGPNLLIKVLKTQVFPGLQVNHIIDVNFSGFADLIDAIGCVYTDVDHRYYNNTLQTDYSSIDIQPGYEKLCGDNQAPQGALAFVRFRHTDNDIVRNARQQDFIRWAKDQYGAGNLISNRDKLLKIFGLHTQTDHNLHTTDGLINLFNLVAFSAAHTIKQIPFPAILLPCGGGGGGTTKFIAVAACYVTADPSAEAHVYRQFMTPTTQAPPKPKPTPKLAAAAGHRAHKSGGSAGTAGLTADPLDGKAQATALAGVGMPVYYPTMIESGTQYCSELTANCNEYPNPATEYTSSYPRHYVIRDQSGRAYKAYRMTLVKNSVIGQYYGVQGMTWQHPPILDKPTQTETMGGKQLMEFFNGSKLSLVAWRTPIGVYWVSNTLTDDIPNKQLIGIAESLTRA
jgi:polyisoprenyl-teichoic acid--peptidoglycan teichoic acid transferase